MITKLPVSISRKARIDATVLERKLGWKTSPVETGQEDLRGFTRSAKSYLDRSIGIGVLLQESYEPICVTYASHVLRYSLLP